MIVEPNSSKNNALTPWFLITHHDSLESVRAIRRYKQCSNLFGNLCSDLFQLLGRVRSHFGMSIRFFLFSVDDKGLGD